MNQSDFYEAGNIITTFCEFQDGESCEPFDPDVVHLHVKDPAGVTTKYTYPADPEIEKRQIGYYSANIQAAVPGWYRYLWFSTGEGEAAQEGSFHVKASKVPR